jgi:hypothetical protein
MEEALHIAITVTQAAIQERRNEAFYVDEARGSGTVDRPTRGTRPDGARNATHRAGASRTQGQNRKGHSGNLGNGEGRKCYECGESGILPVNAPPDKTA